MDWDDLRYFLAIANQKRLAAAARELGVSQATVWRHIARLERALDVRLFRQQGTDYEPSPAGERLLEMAHRVASEIADAQQSLRADASRLQGEVRVTGPEMVIALLPPRLNLLAKRHPQLRVELIVSTPTATLGRRPTDIALLYDAHAQADFLPYASYAVGFGVYASAAYLKRHGSPASIDGFAGHKLIEFDHSAGHVAPFRWTRHGGKNGEVVFRSNSLGARTAAAAAGVGCALLPVAMAAANPDLELIFDAATVGTLDLHILVNDRVRQNPRVGVVLQFICESMEDRSLISDMLVR
jgi:DNA-binding transcriptional LysR family regulator